VQELLSTKQQLNKKIEKSGSASKDVLEILYRFFMQKITGSSETGSLFVSVGSAETQEDVNRHNKKKHSKFLEILHKEGIVPETVYQKIKTIPQIPD
jgi:hypothetical protein